MAGTIVANTLNTDTAGGIYTTNNAYLGIAKAWVNFNPSSGSIVINNSFNVSSVTYNSTGNYTVNFATSMANANYVIAGISDQTLSSGSFHYENIFSATAAGFTIQASNISNGAAVVNPTTVRYMVCGT